MIALEPPDDQDWTATLLRLDTQAKEQDGKGRTAQVAANKSRVELGMVLLAHQPPKGKRGDPTRTNWQMERAKDLNCDERFVRHLIATADTMSKSGLERKVPIEILDRDFKRVRLAVRRYQEHGDPDWKAPKDDTSTSGPAGADSRQVKFLKLAENARKLAAEAREADPENEFWAKASEWLDCVPEPVLSEGNVQPGEEQNSMGGPIAVLDLDERTTKALERAGISMVGDAAARSDTELLKVRDLGRKGLKQIRAALARLGLRPAQKGVEPVTCGPASRDAAALTAGMVAPADVGSTNESEKTTVVVRVVNPNKVPEKPTTISVVYPENKVPAKPTVVRLVPEVVADILPKDTRIRLLAGIYKGCTGDIQRFVKKYGYEVRYIVDMVGGKLDFKRGKGGKMARTYVSPGTRGQTWEVVPLKGNRDGDRHL
jgi:hypothetical protein